MAQQRIVGSHIWQQKFRVRKHPRSGWKRLNNTEQIKVINNDIGVILGHCQYYGVNGNLDALSKFYQYAYWRCLWMLRRRQHETYDYEGIKIQNFSGWLLKIE